MAVAVDLLQVVSREVRAQLGEHGEDLGEEAGIARIDVDDAHRSSVPDAGTVSAGPSTATSSARPAVAGRKPAAGQPGAAYGAAVVTSSELLRAVDASFSVRARHLPSWPDPHPGRPPTDEEYSRVLDPGKWRIVPARAEAWRDAVVELGLADLEPDTTVRWASEPGLRYARVDRLVPRVGGALALVLAFTAFEGDEINGVTIGAGDPAVTVTVAPTCGCDACDAGSQEVLDAVDEHVLGVVSGRFRHLTRRDRTITVHRADGWSANGAFRPGEIEAVLAAPSGWQEIRGSPWSSTR